MLFRDPLVVLRPYPASTPDDAIMRAASVAAAVSARASVVACAVAPRIPRSLLGNAIFDVGALVNEERQKSVADAEKLLRRFDEAVAAHGMVLGDRLSGLHRSDEVPTALADYAKLYDLAIVPMPTGSYVSEFDAQWYAETILFGSGRPAIIVPTGEQMRWTGSLDRVLVAWDQSRCAARAIGDALPILRQAKSVRLVTVTGEKHLSSGRSLTELARHLGVQGVDVTTVEVDAAGRKIGQVLQEEAASNGCDLLVMGAYGRPRFAEFVLGGATNSMLTHPATALFLSH